MRKLKKLVCSDCGREDKTCLPSLPDGGLLCESCEEDYVHCKVCRGFVPEDDACRHVGWVDCGDAAAGWYGCGTEQVIKPDDLRPILRVLGKRRARGLLKALRAHEFHTFALCQSLFIPDLRDAGGRLTDKALKNERWRLSVQYGMAWLQSLQPRVTNEAYDQTAAHVERWLEAA